MRAKHGHRMCLLAMKYCYKIILVHGHAMKITCEMKHGTCIDWHGNLSDEKMKTKNVFLFLFCVFRKPRE